MQTCAPNLWRPRRACLPTDWQGRPAPGMAGRWDMEVPEIHHRHVSHLYGLYPSCKLLPKRHPSFLRRRDARSKSAATMPPAGASAGASTSGRVCAMATMPTRFWRGYCIRAQPIAILFDAHPPFQIDGNFGGAAGHSRNAGQSRPGHIGLLPALPSRWRKGECPRAARQRRCRGGIELGRQHANVRPPGLAVAQSWTVEFSGQLHNRRVDGECR